MEDTKSFIVLKTWRLVIRGTTLQYMRLVKCPSCGKQFSQKIEETYFHFKTEWAVCPQCNYPLSSSNKETEKFNPSRRDRYVSKSLEIL